jgi:hypothetical protein
MVLPWPNALQSPFAFPVKAAVYAARFHGRLAVLFGGSYYMSNQLPWDYLLGYLVLTAPLPILIFGVWGQRVFFQKALCSTAKLVTVLGLMFLFWFPLAMFMVMRPNIYDGLRHFLFVVPPVAVFAGVGAAAMIRSMPRLPLRLTVPVTVLLLMSAVPGMVRLHPYESVYYNLLAGPRASLPMRYEADYWLSSYREAASWLNQAASNRPAMTVAAATTDDSILPVITHFLDPRIRAVSYTFGDYTSAALPTNVDYYVGTTRFMQSENFPTNPIVHTIERDGIVLSVIRENRHE